MGDEMSSVAVPAPRVTINRNPGAQLALALTVFALVLASNSIINESWINSSEELSDGDSVDIDYGLTGLDIDCERSNCETIDESYSDIHEDTCEDSESDACSDIKKMDNAGFVAKIFLIISSIALFAATILQVLSMVGKLRRVPNMISSIGGILVGTSVLVWYLMVPDTISVGETDFDIGWQNMGQGVWMALVASSAALVAGFSGTIQSWIDGPPRMRAHGVRSGLEMNEFVLKESSCGNHTLSILADSDLIRVVSIDRIGASSSVKDILATRRDSYTGFSHQRMDWLDDFKGLWWVLSGATLISSFMISLLFLIPLSIFASLAFLQLMDPERFVVSTNSGNHPFYINRWRSNRELTNLAMDLVDDAMIAVLRGDDLETTTLDARADLIAERFGANQQAMQVKEQVAAEEKKALTSMANQAPIHSLEVENSPGHMGDVVTPSQVPETNMLPQTGQEDLTTVYSEPSEQEMATSAEPKEPEHNEEAAAEAPVTEEVSSEEQLEQEHEEAPVQSLDEETPSQNQEPSSEQPVSIPPPPPLPISPPPQNPPPGMDAMPPPPGMNGMPTSPPPQNPPPGMGVMPPPPGMGTMPPPPGMNGMPPPPGMNGMPPPPGMNGMPPPPGMNGMPPPPGMVEMASPPPIIVQAAPREENLSDDEKDDLLGDLGS